MPTRETHPIDDLFRGKLADMEVPPPPSVWEGIQGARRNRRWLPLWFRSNGLLLAIIPAAVLVVHLSWPSGSENSVTIEEASSASAPVELSMDTQISRSEVASVNVDRTVAEPEQLVPESTKATMAGSGMVDAVAPRSASAYSNASTSHLNYTAGSSESDGSGPFDLPVRNGDELALTSAIDARPDVPGNPDHIEEAPEQLLESGPAIYFEPLLIEYTNPATGASPHERELPPAYVLPPAEWVISAVIGSYDVHRKWHGRDTELVNALDDTEARTTSYAFGLTLGRHWHSGFGITGGVLHERSEQQFQFVDRRTVHDQEVVNYIVTLNSEVFFSDPDTIDHYSTTEQRYESLQRRTVLRIPMEGHYHRRLGRFQYGLRAGIALELTSAEQEHSLTTNSAEGGVEVKKLSADGLRKRHPAMLMATAGLDLGYAINEQWSLGLNPLYMAGVTPLGPAGDVWASPSRWGLQFRISHHFIPKRTR